MAGHSQFKNIMYRKGAQDARRSREFAKLSREISVAARGGSESDSNPRLRLAIQNARARNMPRENIDRAIRKASESGGADWEDVIYEGYASGGVAVLVEASTDNRNRSAATIRAAFSRHGGSLGESGSTSFLFERVGEVLLPRRGRSLDEALEAAISAGGDDVEEVGDRFLLRVAFESLADSSRAFSDALGVESEATETRIARRATSPLEVDEATLLSACALRSALEEEDDVRAVWLSCVGAEDDDIESE